MIVNGSPSRAGNSISAGDGVTGSPTLTSRRSGVSSTGNRGGHDNAHTAVQVRVADQLCSQLFDVEHNAVVELETEDLAHEITHGADVVGDVLGEQIDITSRATLIKCGQQHSTLENQSITKTRLR